MIDQLVVWFHTFIDEILNDYKKNERMVHCEICEAKDEMEPMCIMDLVVFIQDMDSSDCIDEWFE